VNLTKEYSGFTVGVWNMPYVQALNRKEGKEIQKFQLHLHLLSLAVYSVGSSILAVC
jgi:hypothetical protein